MTHDDAFLADIVGQMDDGPRLVYADWLDDRGEADRADFIRVQIELARLPAGSQRGQELYLRQIELLRHHAERWARGLGRWDQSRPPGSLVDQPAIPMPSTRPPATALPTFVAGSSIRSA